MTTEEIKSLVEKWGPIIDVSKHIYTWTEVETLAFLAEQASRSLNVVELGVYMGRTSRVMLDAGCGHLWSVDKFMVAGTQETTKHFLGKYLENGRSEIIVGDSKAAAAMLQHMAGKIDLCFCDDGHETWQVKEDIASFLPLLRPGGMICGHDFDHSDGDNNVAIAVKETLQGWTEPVPRLWAYVKP